MEEGATETMDRLAELVGPALRKRVDSRKVDKYREDVKKWAIFNQDKEVDRVSGATFNVLVVEQDWMPKE
jgi:hypothetical protein